MPSLSDLAYDIEQLYIEGCHPTKIARILGCPLGMVYDWLENENVSKDEQLYADYDPYSTVNS